MLTLILAAAAQAVAPPSLPAKPAAAADKKVCQTEEDVTSRVRYKKICLKQSEWDAIAKETQEGLAASRNDRTLPPPQ